MGTSARALAFVARRLLAEKVHPAFARLKGFIESEYLQAARTELGRQEQEEQTATLNLEDVLETIRILATKLLRESKNCLRVDGVNLGLLQETLAEARAGRTVFDPGP